MSKQCDIADQKICFHDEGFRNIFVDGSKSKNKKVTRRKPLLFFLILQDTIPSHTWPKFDYLIQRMDSLRNV